MTLPDWARPLIIESIDQTRWPIEWLERQITNGRFKVWTNDTGCIVASIKVYPTGLKDVEGIVAAGELEAIKELIPQALAWGKSKGCIDGLIESRREWAAVLEPFGWTEHQTTIRKVL